MASSSWGEIVNVFVTNRGGLDPDTRAEGCSYRSACMALSRSRLRVRAMTPKNAPSRQWRDVESVHGDRLSLQEIRRAYCPREYVDGCLTARRSQPSRSTLNAHCACRTPAVEPPMWPKICKLPMKIKTARCARVLTSMSTCGSLSWL